MTRFLAFPAGWAWIGVLAIAAPAALRTAGAQTPVQVVSAMAAREVAARNQDNLYSYTAEEVSARTGGHRWTEKVVETTDGPLHRLLAVDGSPLTPEQARLENDRIAAILRNPDEFRRAGRAHRDDEGRAQQLLQLLPKAFVISPDGEQGGCVRYAFRPNPAYQPSTYEERIAAAMAGTVSMKEPEGRLCTLEATLSHPVEFGFGLLGRVEEGGRFRLERGPVDSTHWKSDRISVHVQGRVLMLKTLTREQEVRRTEVRLISQQTTLQQAAALLAR